jgi:hypothetical protein
MSARLPGNDLQEWFDDRLAAIADEGFTVVFPEEPAPGRRELLEGLGVTVLVSEYVAAFQVFTPAEFGRFLAHVRERVSR